MHPYSNVGALVPDSSNRKGSTHVTLSFPFVPQVNGTDVSSLCRAEVLRLLAGPEKILCVVLYREPSATLL